MDALPPETRHADEPGELHDREITGGGKAGVLNEKFRAINTLIADVKNTLIGTYHAIKFATYSHRLMAELQFRFDRRHDTRAILGSLLRAWVAAPKRPERGIRGAEVDRQSGEACIRPP